jgi:hypothetical protein
MSEKQQETVSGKMIAIIFLVLIIAALSVFLILIYRDDIYAFAIDTFHPGLTQEEPCLNLAENGTCLKWTETCHDDIRKWCTISECSWTYSDECFHNSTNCTTRTCNCWCKKSGETNP